MSIGLTKLDIQRNGNRHNQSTLKLEVMMVDSPPRALRKRQEMTAIGLVMMVATSDPQLAEYVATKVGLDPEKFQAVLGLIGCTKEDLEKEEELVKDDYKAQFKKALAEGADFDANGQLIDPLASLAPQGDAGDYDDLQKLVGGDALDIL